MSTTTGTGITGTTTTTPAGTAATMMLATTVTTSSHRRDVAVYASGGGMRGVFGAGVLHALAELGVRERTTACYGISAGAFNILQFAAGSTTRLLEWYVHYIPRHGIMAHATPLDVLRGTDAIDLPEAGRVIDTERLLDLAALQRCPIPVSLGVVERNGLAFRWLDARRADASHLVLASSSIFPFVHDSIEIDGVPYIDGGYREIVCFTRLRREHPDSRLLLILNDNNMDEPLVERLVMRTMLRLRYERLADVWIDTRGRMESELDEALATPRTLVLRPEGTFPVHFATTDEATLAHGFWLGYRTVLTQRDRLLRFIED